MSAGSARRWLRRCWVIGPTANAERSVAAGADIGAGEPSRRQLGGAREHTPDHPAARGDAEIKELAKAELEDLKKRKPLLEDELKFMLLPADPRDAKSVILEIRAGTGGEEAALFGANLLRMYTKYAESKRWKVEVISMNTTGIGGIKEVVASIEGKGAYSRLK